MTLVGYEEFATYMERRRGALGRSGACFPSSGLDWKTREWSSVFNARLVGGILKYRLITDGKGQKANMLRS